MSLSRHHGAGWLPFEDLEASWARIARHAGVNLGSAGQSVEGRSIPLLEVGPESGRPVLLTGLMHGIEWVGGLALLRAAEAWLQRETQPLRLVILPIVNPDAVALNLDRLRRGQRSGRRSNLRGVDLNRNFARFGARIRHPLSGSERPGRPYYMGPRPFSEPETRALAEVAARVRPALALGFHSFGELVLYPWAHTPKPHPRERTYRRLGAAFQSGQPGRSYGVRAAHTFYPTTGDLDDWLDDAFGTLALTIEVGRLDRRVLHPRRIRNPFHWMNPREPEVSVERAVGGTQALLETFARQTTADHPWVGLDEGRRLPIAAQ